MKNDKVDSRDKKLGGESGQAVLEFAIFAPIFFMVLLAMADIGRFIYLKHLMDTATRAGARIGATRVDSAEAVKKASDASTDILNQAIYGGNPCTSCTSSSSSSASKTPTFSDSPTSAPASSTSSTTVGNFTVTVTLVPVGGRDAVQVSSAYNFSPLLKWGGFSFVPPTTLNSKTLMYKEG